MFLHFFESWITTKQKKHFNASSISPFSTSEHFGLFKYIYMAHFEKKNHVSLITLSDVWLKLFERSSELGCPKNKWTKKKGTTMTFTFLSKFLPFHPSFNLQNFPPYFRLPHFTQKIFWEIVFRKKHFSEKKNQKTIYSFFFFDFFIFFWIEKKLCHFLRPKDL